jgi:predicted nucleic acid-binding protein
VILYLDTSALIKLYIQETDSERVKALVARASALTTSVVAYAEARATFARRHRERRATSVEHAALLHRFEADWRALVAVNVTAAIAHAAGAMAERFGLRGFDAIHLATFEQILARAGDDEVTFSAADDRLVRAARRLG